MDSGGLPRWKQTHIGCVMETNSIGQRTADLEASNFIITPPIQKLPGELYVQRQRAE